MDSIEQKIRSILDEKGMTIKELARETDLSYFVVQNFIRGKIRRASVLKAIANALNINPETIDTSFSPVIPTIKDSIKDELDVERFNFALSIVNKSIHQFQIYTPKNLVEKITYALYKFIEENKKASDESLKHFVYGAIYFGIDNDLIFKK